MTAILVLGAGKIGVAVAGMLAGAGDFQVTLADGDREGLLARTPPGVSPLELDASDGAALRRALAGNYAAVCALPYFLTVAAAEAARDCGVHYFDLTEDVTTARAIRALSEGGNVLMAPQCGLAPGFVSIVANHLAGRMDEPLDVRLRVGALPQYPDNALKYNLTWSIDGLINEYCNPCEAIHEGRLVELLPLEGLEEFSLDGEHYEAFSTSGGVGSLCESLAGRVRSLSYKTVRYPGHRNLIHLLARDLRLCERRDIFKDLIAHGVPVTRQDVVLVFISVTGRRRGLLSQESFVRKIYGDGEAGWSAIQKTTAASVCAILDLHRQGKLPASGFLRQETVPYPDFIANRFAAPVYG